MKRSSARNPVAAVAVGSRSASRHSHPAPETGSSATIKRGRSTRARAMRTRWRWPPLNSCADSARAEASSPTARVKECRCALAASAAGFAAVDRHRLTDNLLYGHPGISEPNGSWKMVWCSSQASQLRSTGMEHVVAVEGHLAGIRLDQPQRPTAQGVRTGLADQAQGFSGIDRQPDVVDRWRLAASPHSEGGLVRAERLAGGALPPPEACADGSKCRKAQNPQSFESRWGRGSCQMFTVSMAPVAVESRYCRIRPHRENRG